MERDRLTIVTIENAVRNGLVKKIVEGSGSALHKTIVTNVHYSSLQKYSSEI